MSYPETKVAAELQELQQELSVKEECVLIQQLRQEMRALKLTLSNRIQGIGSFDVFSTNFDIKKDFTGLT